MTEAGRTAGTRKLGTFLGVFTPSILTILGVIMYLRIGWVVGSAGLANTLLIVVLANSITLTTALSMSAVATNMRVETGGAYFIISRSLGLEIGGAIGIPLYLSQALSVTLYSFGFAEALRLLWPGAPLVPVAAVTIAAVTLVSLRSAALTLKLQVPLLVFVGLSILSLFAGIDPDGHRPVMFGNFEAEGAGGFWLVFAVFFPAVTGIMAGISLSGDLKDPQKSLPKGTIAAVLVGLAAYLVIPVVLSLSAAPDDLIRNPLIWTSIALVPVLVAPGLLCAILSSAVGSILGAPRTLQAMAEDRVLPRILARTSKKGEPVPAIILSAGIAPPVPIVESYSSKLIGEMIASSDEAVSIVPADIAEELVRIAGVAIVPYSLVWTLPPIALFTRAADSRSPARDLLVDALREVCRETYGDAQR